MTLIMRKLQKKRTNLEILITYNIIILLSLVIGYLFISSKESYLPQVIFVTFCSLWIIAIWLASVNMKIEMKLGCYLNNNKF